MDLDKIILQLRIRLRALDEAIGQFESLAASDALICADVVHPNKPHGAQLVKPNSGLPGSKRALQFCRSVSVKGVRCRRRPFGRV